jgi:curved DNA-binding protein CbpA
MFDRKKEFRKCDHPDCGLEGTCRAPKDRSLKEYWWFCPKHAAEYNKSWNYYDGMSIDEIETETRLDETWHAPTFKFGLSLDGLARSGRLEDPLSVYEKFMKAPGVVGRRVAPAKPLSGKEKDAVDLFDIRYPFTMASLRARYMKLVKLHHPDVNGGSKEHEEAFKKVVSAYAVLSKMAC